MDVVRFVVTSTMIVIKAPIVTPPQYRIIFHANMIVFFSPFQICRTIMGNNKIKLSTLHILANNQYGHKLFNSTLQLLLKQKAKRIK